MFAIPRRYGHFLFAVIQSGLTCLIAAGVASLPLVKQLIHWLLSWIVSWVAMLPVVILAAPLISINFCPSDEGRIGLRVGSLGRPVVFISIAIEIFLDIDLMFQ